MWQQPHMHDFYILMQLFCTKSFNVSATETPKKTNIYYVQQQGVEFAPGTILSQCQLFISRLLVSTIWQQFFYFSKKKFKKNLYQHLANPMTTTQALHKAWL
jgi:hypothetical protein